MDRYYQVLGNREMGTQVPVSIATALALESAMGLSEDHPEHKQKPPLQSVDALWVNLRTLIRNIMGAIPTQDQDKVFPDPLLDALTAELRIIASAVQMNTQRRCKLVPYVQSYHSLKSQYKNCFIREPKTPKQEFFAELESNVLRRIPEMHLDMAVVQSDMKLPQNSDDALIITHMPLDLLSRYEFSRLRLLESHTGKVKAYTSWNSKLTGGKELSRMPFNHVTLQFFGDGVHFNTFPMKEKKQIIELAEARRWNPTTSLDKMRMDINAEPLHPTFKAILLSMF